MSFFIALHHLYLETPERECPDPRKLQEIFRAHANNPSQIEQELEQASLQPEVSHSMVYALALADMANACAKFDTAQLCLLPFYQKHNRDFRFQDVWARAAFGLKNGKLNHETLGFEKKGLYCPFALRGLLVDISGDLFPCCGPMVTKPFGNCQNSPIIDIMNNSVAQQFREAIFDGSYRYCSKLHCTVYNTELVPRDQFSDTSMLRDLPAEGEMPDQFEPKHVELSMDRSCNLSCPICRKEKIMEPRHAELFWDYMLKNNLDPVFRRARCLVFSGTGDPFASLAYMNLMARLNPREYPELRLILQTNGLLLTERTWQRISHLSGMIDELSLSIDAASPQTYHMLRRGGNWEQLLKNLQLFKRLKSEKHIQRIKFNFVVQNLNFHEMEAFFDLATAFDADQVHFQKLANIFPDDADGSYIRNKVDLPWHPNHSAFLEMIHRSFFSDHRVRQCFLPQHA